MTLQREMMNSAQDSVFSLSLSKADLLSLSQSLWF